MKKKFTENCCQFFCKIFCNKTLFTPNFIGNTCKFYNFVENNYPRRNYLPIKSFRKNNRKKSFLTNCFNKFVRRFSCNIRILVVISASKKLVFILFIHTYFIYSKILLLSNLMIFNVSLMFIRTYSKVNYLLIQQFNENIIN